MTSRETTADPPTLDLPTADPSTLDPPTLDPKTWEGLNPSPCGGGALFAFRPCHCGDGAGGKGYLTKRMVRLPRAGGGSVTAELGCGRCPAWAAPQRGRAKARDGGRLN